MNESIDRNIKVRARDFAQHISAYNAASQYGLIEGLKDITQLTKTGATAINQLQTYNDNEADYDELMSAASNPETVSRFASLKRELLSSKI